MRMAWVIEIPLLSTQYRRNSDALWPAYLHQETMPRIWREKAMIDVAFVEWRYVMELRQRKLSPAQVFDRAVRAAPAGPAKPADKKRIKGVFISSTGIDLHEYREAAREVCERLQFLPIMMEHFEVMGEGATAGSKKKLDQADLYVGIFAHRYGYIEKGYPTSVTETEFDYAWERKIDRPGFVVDPNFPWPPNTLDPEHHEQMEAFKKRIEKSLIRGSRRS
jgi:Domain of unknown function (DUF4062)